MPHGNDIFSRHVQFGGVFSADGASLTFSGGASTPLGPGMLVQSVQWQYQQNITRLYEVSSDQIFLVAGRTQGQAALQRVLGPTALSVEFYEQYGDVCNIENNDIIFAAQTDCSADDEGTYGDTITITLKHCVIVKVGGAVGAQDMIINESLAVLFLFMTYAVAPGAG
jgi:hypothetical protein